MTPSWMRRRSRQIIRAQEIVFPNGGRIAEEGDAFCIESRSGMIRVGMGAGAGARQSFGFLDEADRPEPPRLEVVESGDLVVGYRTWSLDVAANFSDGEMELSPALVSDSCQLHWPPRQRMTAVCLERGSAHEAPVVHEAPYSRTGCGIYARKDGNRLGEVGCDAVIGEVWLWGRVIEHERGYRAEYAYPKRLWLLSSSQAVVRELELAYGVPCSAV